MTDRDDEKCPVCEDWILPEDTVQDITSVIIGDIDVEDTIVEHLEIHASCFMDLIVIDDVRGGKINRTAIMEGRVKRREDDDHNYYLEIVE